MTREEALLSIIDALPSEPVARILSLGVCPRCIFRFFGLRDPIYSDYFASWLVDCKLKNYKVQCNASNEQSTSAESEYIEKKLNEPCIACIGILQTLDIAEVVPTELEKNSFSCKTQILTALKEEGHKFSDFCLEVTIPGVVLVRERALWQHLQDDGYKSYFQGKNASSHVVSLKEALKLALVESLEETLGAVYNFHSSFRISIQYKHVESSQELEFLGSSVLLKCKRKRNDSKSDATGVSTEQTESLAAIQRSLTAMSSTDFSELYRWPPPKQSKCCQVSVSCYRTSVYVGGRYLKFSRNLSQSPWVIDCERMGDGSVQEVIADIIFPHFKADSYKFHAAGREDIDVRMLGSGRPFILEISNARIVLACEDIQQLEESINNSKEGWVNVKNLQLVGNDAWNSMLEGESEKQKQYTAVIWLSRLLEGSEISEFARIKDLQIQQKTPVRVLHRRSHLVRPRIIHSIRLERIAGTEQYFLLHLCTQAGTYIKEFVHGDLGRTYPNVGSLLGCQAEILQLDVTDIKMDLFN